MKIIAMIPARLAATRFPNKPLAPLLGLSMIEHVRRRVKLCPLLNDVVVATCDKEIQQVVEANGGKVAITSDKHERCTDRIAEASQEFPADIIVNVQGDEPLVHPRMIEEVLSPLLTDPTLPSSNLMASIVSDEEFKDVNVVKVVMNSAGDLLYASREPIPSPKKAEKKHYNRWKQLGIIAFRADFLQKFWKLPPTPLEIIESVDMNRAIEHGYKVRMVETKARMIGVDVPEQVKEVEELLRKDPLLKQYAS